MSWKEGRALSWRDWPVYSEECQRDVLELLKNGGPLSAYRANPKHGVGPQEDSWAWKAERLAEQIHNVKHVIVCSSGTMAWGALLGVLRPEYVSLPALTFSATVTQFYESGTTLHFDDVVIPDCTLDPKLSSHGIPVDLFGKQAPGMPYGIADSCQAVGIPPVADHGVWSFQGGKNVPAGEGGAVYTQSDQVAHQVRLAINHKENFGDFGVSGNGRMNELTACLVWHGLCAVKERNAQRCFWAGYLNTMLVRSGLPFIVPNMMNHAFYRYPLILPHSMMSVAGRLKAAGVECQPGYIQPTLDEYLAFRHIPRGDLTNTHSLSKDRLLLFPQVNPCATEAEITRLGEQILKACEGLYE